MIRTEMLEDGRKHIWSDAGYKIQQETGIVYDDAVDSVHHEYTETDIPIEPDGINDSDKAEAYDILIGEVE